jgi:hypothetical protein
MDSRERLHSLHRRNEQRGPRPNVSIYYELCELAHTLFGRTNLIIEMDGHLQSRRPT